MATVATLRGKPGQTGFPRSLAREGSCINSPKKSSFGFPSCGSPGRARRIQRFLSQPMFVSEVFTGRPGRYVPVAETVRGFKEILEGKYDSLPEQAFYMAGPIEDVIAQAEKMRAV